MTEATQRLQARLQELRESFDRGFGEPLATVTEDSIELIRIRVGQRAYALRSSEIAGLEADRTVTPLPSDNRELLGIAGVRGAVVAVFDLALFLDLPPSEAPRWLVLARASPTAFAFTAFEGQLRVHHDAVSVVQHGAIGCLREFVQHNGESLPLIDVRALVAALEGRARPKQIGGV